MAPNLSLKFKILGSLFVIASLSVGSSLFGVWNLFQLEQKLQQTNMEYIPLLKSLSQLENLQYLLDNELSNAITSGQDRLESLHAQAMQSKLTRMQKLFDQGQGDMQIHLASLEKRFALFLTSIEDVFQKKPSSEVYFSSTRAAFKNQLRQLISKVDQDIQRNSLEVQSNIGQSLLLVGLLFALLCALSGLIFYKIDEILQPLEGLTKIVKRISKHKSPSSEWGELTKYARRSDEIGVFSKEFSRMTSSLLDRNQQLEQQQITLEKAHQSMRKHNEALQKTKSKLLHQEKLGLIGKLSAQMAHEIRNPLNALSLQLETLEFDMPAPTEDFQKTVACMQEQIQYLSSLTDSYLSLAKAPDLKFEHSDLNELIEKLERLYMPYLKEKKVEWRRETEPLPPLMLDRNQIAIVLGNLMKNACEAIENKRENFPKESFWIHVKSRYNKDRKQVEMEFRDNGPGIVEGESVFTPFFTTKAKGTGLGLAHSKQIINAHKGEISILPATGTCFLLQFPAEQGWINV